MKVFEIIMQGNFAGAFYLVAARNAQQAVQLASEFKECGIISFGKRDWDEAAPGIVVGLSCRGSARVVCEYDWSE